MAGIYYWYLSWKDRFAEIIKVAVLCFKKKKKSRDKHACFVVVIVKYLYCYNAEKTSGQDTTVLCKYYKGQPRLKDITVKTIKKK